MSSVKIIFYDLSNGTEPAKDFILSLDTKMRAKMVRMVKLLEENGGNLRMPYSEHLDDGIFELRACVGNDISRVLYFFFIGGCAVLTNGFIKKTQKTPEQQLELAKKYRAEYIGRKGNAQ